MGFLVAWPSCKWESIFAHSLSLCPVRILSANQSPLPPGGKESEYKGIDYVRGFWELALALARPKDIFHHHLHHHKPPLSSTKQKTTANLFSAHLENYFCCVDHNNIRLIPYSIPSAITHPFLQYEVLFPAISAGSRRRGNSSKHLVQQSWYVQTLIFHRVVCCSIHHHGVFMSFYMDMKLKI